MTTYKKISKLLAVLVLTVAMTIGCKKTIDQEQVALNNEKNEVATTKSLQGSSAFCDPASANPTARQYANARAVAQSNTVSNTDYVSAGVGGLRNTASGTITLSGVSGTVTKAYLYWHGVTNSTTDAGSTITINGNSASGTHLGYSSDNCWGHNNSQAYRADVTFLVTLTGNGSYALTGFGSPNLNLNGASLIVFFNDGNPANNRDVVIFDGNDSNIPFAGISGNPNAPADPLGWNVALNGITYTSGTANLQLHVADGQVYPDDALILNASTLDAGPAIFQGTSVPGVNNGPLNNGNLWDIKNYNITSFLSPGTNNLNLTTGVIFPGGDCLGLIVAIIDLPVIKVPFDVKPTSCPNPLNVTEKGTLPTAILGSAGFDVSKIDVSTIKINGESPKEWYLLDVAAPFTGNVNSCTTCTTAGPDGIMDLVVKVDAQAIIATLGTTTDGSCRSLIVTGNLKAADGGFSIIGEDFIRINKKKK